VCRGSGIKGFQEHDGVTRETGIGGQHGKKEKEKGPTTVSAWRKRHGVGNDRSVAPGSKQTRGEKKREKETNGHRGTVNTNLRQNGTVTR